MHLNAVPLVFAALALLDSRVTSMSLVEAQTGEASTWTYDDHVGEMDVVGEATIVSGGTSKWQPNGQCGPSGSSLPTLTLHLRVERLIAGTIATRTMPIRALVGYPTVEQARPGARVFFWGQRICEDDWNVWGKCLLITASGQIDPQVNLDHRLIKSPDGSRYLSADEMRSKLEAIVDDGAMSQFSEPRELVAVRVTKVVRGTPPRGVTCEGLRLDSRNDERPDTLTIAFEPRQRYGWHTPSLGDTLVVPVHTHATGRPVALSIAPDLCSVRNGFIRALGVSYDSRMTAYSTGRDGLRLKPYHDSADSVHADSD